MYSLVEMILMLRRCCVRCCILCAQSKVGYAPLVSVGFMGYDSVWWHPRLLVRSDLCTVLPGVLVVGCKPYCGVVELAVGGHVPMCGH